MSTALAAITTIATTGVFGYLHMGGSDLISAFIDAAGVIRTVAGRSEIEDVDLSEARWITRRSITAILTDLGVKYDLRVVSLWGPAGGETDLGRVLLSGSDERNTRFYATDDFIEKMDEERAATLIPLVAAQYAASTTRKEVAAAA